MSTKRYRPNVAAVVLNHEGMLLACERSDIAGVWQLPQGGMEKGETPEQALYRELREEIGTDAVKIIGRLGVAIRYDWPKESKGFHGQEQTYFLVRLEDETKINLSAHNGHHEFVAREWLTMSAFVERLSGFKAAAYSKALDALDQQFPETIKR